MANRGEATLVFKIVSTGGKVLKSLWGGTKKVGKETAKTGATLTAVYAATTAAIVKFGQQGVKFRSLQNAFANLAASQGKDSAQMLDNMKKLSGGTVSDMELMKQANNALLLGLPVERMGEIIKLARGAAAATGESVEFQLKSLVTGLGRGSKLMLDNAGIIVDTQKSYERYAISVGKSVDALTDQEKKQAFINEGLRKGNLNLKRQGGVVNTASDDWASFGETIKNIRDRLAVFAIPAFREVVRTTKPMIELFDRLSKHPIIEKFAIGFTKAFTVVNVGMETVTKTFMEAFAGPFEAIPEFIAGNFQKARTLLSKEGKSINQIMVEQKQVLNQRLQQVDDDFAELKKNKKAQGFRDLEAQQREHQLNEELAEAEANDKKLEKMAENQQLQLDMIGLSEEEKNLKLREFQLKRINDELKNEKSKIKRINLLKAKQNALEAVADAKKKEKKKKDREEELKDETEALNTFATLQNSSNKTLAAIGKAAAITQIAIRSPAAIASSYAYGSSIGGPPLGSVFAGIARAAMAAQMAQVVGVQLAEGGIVPASHGGTQATIGEGGRAEAVVPLPDDFDPDSGSGLGGNITIVVNGGLLGDPSSAREFAVAVDKELTELRRNNESDAFDEDII